LYCFQCQETAKNEACTVRGVCGKPEETADLQDVLIYVTKGIAVYGEKLRQRGLVDEEAARFIRQALFVTVTNTAWDDDKIVDWVREGLEVRSAVRERLGDADLGALPDCATWAPQNEEEIMAKALSDEVRITSTRDADVRSLRELLIIGCKGIAAYADHAAVLGYQQDEIDGFLMEALASTTRDLETDEMIALVMKAGDVAVKTMALLDEAHTTTYGDPEMTEVNIGVRDNPHSDLRP